MTVKPQMVPIRGSVQMHSGDSSPRDSRKTLTELIHLNPGLYAVLDNMSWQATARRTAQ